MFRTWVNEMSETNDDKPTPRDLVNLTLRKIKLLEEHRGISFLGGIQYYMMNNIGSDFTMYVALLHELSSLISKYEKSLCKWCGKSKENHFGTPLWCSPNSENDMPYYEPKEK